MIITGKEKIGIECKCDGCRRKIKASDPRETFSDTMSDGAYLSKTFCAKCVSDIVRDFKKHIQEKEDKALIQMAKEAN